jgi:hypothetical protein
MTLNEEYRLCQIVVIRSSLRRRTPICLSPTIVGLGELGGYKENAGAVEAQCIDLIDDLGGLSAQLQRWRGAGGRLGSREHKRPLGIASGGLLARRNGG